MHAIAVLGYLQKSNRGLGLAISAHFLHDFSIKVFIISYSIKSPSFNVITFFFSRYQKKYVMKLLFRELMTSQTLRFIFDHPLMIDSEKKTGSLKYKNLNISRMTRAFEMK